MGTLPALKMDLQNVYSQQCTPSGSSVFPFSAAVIPQLVITKNPSGIWRWVGRKWMSNNWCGILQSSQLIHIFRKVDGVYPGSEDSVCVGGGGVVEARDWHHCVPQHLSPLLFEVLCLSKLRTCTLWLVYLVSLPWGPHLSPVCWNCRWLPCLPSFYLVSGDQTSLQDTYFIHWVFSPAQHFILNHRLTLLDAPLWGQCDLLKEAWLHSFSSPGEGGVRLSSGKR